MGSRRGRVCVLRRAQRRRQAYLARFEPFPRRLVPRLLASKRGRKAPLPFPTRRALAPRRTAFSRPSSGAPREPWGFPPQGFPDLPSPGQGNNPLEPAAAVVAEPFTVPDSPPSPTAPRSLLARPAFAGSPSGAGLPGSAARRGRQGREERAPRGPLFSSLARVDCPSRKEEIMGKVSYGQSGYVGSSMSVRAVEAYAGGEMPKSK